MSHPVIDRAYWHLSFDLGPVHLDQTGRGVFYFWTTVAVLALAAIPVLLSRKEELRKRLTTWICIAPLVGIPLWIGSWAAALLGSVIALVAILEYSKLADMPRVDTAVTTAMVVALPWCAWLQPRYLGLVPFLALVLCFPAMLQGDTANGFRRGALAAFGMIWIGWSLAHLVLLGRLAYVVCFAAAAADVAAWCGGKGLGKLPILKTPLSKLSPNKTIAGLVGATLGSILVLALLGQLKPGLVIAVALGGVTGDLLESMVKRSVGVKDAGAWLPGFGGLLDRVDSLLIVLPLAYLLI